jgi:alpha-mannosidase
MRRSLKRLPERLLVCSLMLSFTVGQSQKTKSVSTSEKEQSKRKVSKISRSISTLTRNAPGPTVKLPPLDLTRESTLYLIGYAHLDTQWRWEYPQVIREYLTKTMRNNFALFEKYPHYIFNFTGANRYMMLKEYYPADYAKLKNYVAAGRWFPAGSSIEEGDVNSPNAESIIRQILYGNQFFRREFGKASVEYMLPDCFGFPASLPSLLAHAGIKGFSTQKLSSTWQPGAEIGGPGSLEKTPEGIPFNVGLWEGPDGKTVIAALNPGGYTSRVTSDLSKNNFQPRTGNQGDYIWDWPSRIDLNGKLTNLFADYHYVGTGDLGGSPDENSVKLVEAITNKSTAVLPMIPRSQGSQDAVSKNTAVQVGDGPLKVKWSKADEMFLDILRTGQLERLPRYKGDLELINHSAGSITSQAYMKRWNRKNEILADAAEKASVAAAWLGGRTYPQERLNHAWRLVLGGQFHDILAGTATPRAFEFAWNDEAIASNQFAEVLTSATEAIASGMDTRGDGVSIIVYNPLERAREDIVEANVTFADGIPKAVRVIGPDGKNVPAQLAQSVNGSSKVLFLAKVPPVGYAVYDVQPAQTTDVSDLSITESSLENARYRITVNESGDVSEILDKKLNRELLSAPIRLAILTDNPREYPAWNMDFEDEQRAPRAFVGGPAKIRIVENGAVQVALEISRETEDSRFVQTVRLSTGDSGNRIEFNNVIDWKAKEANLKVAFPLTARNKVATYNWDVGTVERPNANERQFEVASHQWVDITDQSGEYGVTVLTDCKNGSDKPNDETLRLTLLRTPGTRGSFFVDQDTQDWGHHEFVFGLTGHSGDWRHGQTDWQAYRLNQPLLTFESSKHAGALGRKFSLLKLSNDRVRLLALKKAEESDEVIVRLVEIDGKAQKNLRVSFAGEVASAREVDGQEHETGKAIVSNSTLVTSLAPYQIRSFAVKLVCPSVKVRPLQWKPVILPYDISVATEPDRPASGCFDCSLDRQVASQGKALPAEMLPREINYGGIRFALAPTSAPNAITAQRQKIDLPAGQFNRVYILAAAANGDQKGTFRIGSKQVDLTIQNWTGFIGQWDDRKWNSAGLVDQWDNRRWNAKEDQNPYAEMTGITPGFIKRADVAWFASHRHAADGSKEPYAYSYLFAYSMDVPADAQTITLPTNDNIRILAISLVNELGKVRPAQPLYDTLERH